MVKFSLNLAGLPVANNNKRWVVGGRREVGGEATLKKVVSADAAER